ncbi:MAG: hypothetical protein ACE5OZ_19790 [Candidatus Heimdallarchaeota archaeon]
MKVNSQVGIPLSIGFPHAIDAVIPPLLPFRLGELPLLIRPQLALPTKEKRRKSLVLIVVFPVTLFLRRFLGPSFQPLQFSPLFWEEWFALPGELALIVGESLVGLLCAPLGFPIIQWDELLLALNERLGLSNGGTDIPGIG